MSSGWEWSLQLFGLGLKHANSESLSHVEFHLFGGYTEFDTMGIHVTVEQTQVPENDLYLDK